MVITAGIRVVCRDAEWLVKNVSLMEGSDRHHIVHCVGVDDLVRGHEGIFITQLDKVIPVNPRKTELVADSSSGYRMSKLFLEAQLRQMPAAGIEPDFTGMGIFQLLKFQEWTVRKALEQLRPRLLLADAVGLGKTIQVGMILTELLRRGRANRILVLAKKSMLTQFQAELWNRFNIPLVRLDSVGIAKLRLRVPANKNPFEVYHRVIISLDTLKNVARYEHFLRDARWDVVVIDEAHNVAGASVPERHLSYRLARLLSSQTESMLLTTATPHNGKEEDFQAFLALLDSDRFYGKYRDGVHQVDTADLMRRMVKEELLKFDGTPIGAKDRIALLSLSLKAPLQGHLRDIKAVHEKDLAAGLVRVPMPDVLDRNYPNASKEWRWQWIFPQENRWRNAQIGEKGRQGRQESRGRFVE